MNHENKSLLQSSMFRAGVETMFPIGSLVCHKKSTLKPVYVNLKTTNTRGQSVLVNSEPFTIIDTHFPSITLVKNEKLFFDFQVYFQIIQFDIIGWIYFWHTASNYDSALQHLGEAMSHTT